MASNEIDDRSTRSSNIKVPKLKGRLPAPLAFLAYICLALMSFAAGWAVIVEDPLGGEPVARIALDPQKQNPRPGGGRGGDNGGEATEPLRSAQDNQTNQTVPASQPVPVPSDSAKVVALNGDVVVKATPGLLEKTHFGDLPKIAADGSMAVQAYARVPPVLERNIPRIAIVLGGMGLSVVGTEAAISKLPGEVSVAFAPYGRDIRRLADLARQSGHEILIQVPMEPYDYPDNDPGPHTLLTGLSERQNLDRLHWVMGRVPSYIGISNYLGAQFSARDVSVEPILRELRNRGVGFFDDGSAQQSVTSVIADRLGLAYAKADVVIDASPERETIEDALDQLEKIAVNRGLAIGAASALPITINEIADWSRDLSRKGIALVPVSSTMKAMR